MGPVYLSLEYTGEAGATMAGRYADDVEAIVVDSASNGVACGRHAEGPMISVAKGVATRLSTAR